MVYMVTWGSTFENVMQLIGLVIVFIIILVAAYFTSRLVGTSAVSNLKNRNFKVIETYKVAPNRFLQIIEVSGKFIVIGVSKDHIEYITEINADQVIKNDGEITPLTFKDILSNIKNKKDNNKNK